MTALDRADQGRRVELVSTNDSYTRLKPGAKGTYKMAIVNDDMIQHCIQWDDGSTLMLVEGVDQFKFLDARLNEGSATDK
jgi:hypothetical protein